MENLNIEEINQLMLFYKHKSSELEFENLKLQIKLNNISVDNSNKE